MRYFPHILRTVRMGRTRVLPIRPVLRDARNLPAPIVSVIIGLPLPVFATACILLPAALPLCRSSPPAKKARLSKVSLFYYPVWAFVSPPPTFCASVQKTFPDELLADLGPIGHGMFLSVDEPQRTAQIAVVDVKVCMNLRRRGPALLRRIFVHGVERNAPDAEPFHRAVQQFPCRIE